MIVPQGAAWQKCVVGERLVLYYNEMVEACFCVFHVSDLWTAGDQACP
jgi:hypothetical protein